MKVEIRIEDRDMYEPTEIEVLVEGKSLGTGRIGGEPEDNCIARDYAWIVPMFAALASKLGAEVVTRTVPPT